MCFSKSIRGTCRVDEVICAPVLGSGRSSLALPGSGLPTEIGREV